MPTFQFKKSEGAPTLPNRYRTVRVVRFAPVPPSSGLMGDVHTVLTLIGCVFTVLFIVYVGYAVVMAQPAPDISASLENANTGARYKVQPLTGPEGELYLYAKKEFGITSLRVEKGSLFVEFPSERYTAPNARKDLSAIAEAIARKWGTLSTHTYINCHVYRGDTEFTNGKW